MWQCELSKSPETATRLRPVVSILLAGIGLLLAPACTQNVTVTVNPKPEYGYVFVVSTPEQPDRRYWEAGKPRRFPSGSVLSLDKSACYRLALVDESGAHAYEETLRKFPKTWYEVLLTPVFGLGHALWEPYPNPYVIDPALSADQRLRLAADRLSAEVVARFPAAAKAIGLCTIETDVVEKGRSFPFASEGNRRLSEYMFEAVRRRASPSLRVRQFKMGIDWYLKHTFDNLGESVEARQELVGRFAKQEQLDLVVYGKNYLYPQVFAPGATIERCRLSVELLEPTATAVATKEMISFTIVIDPREQELMALFMPRREVVEGDARPPIEVVCERAAMQIARDLLEKFKDSTALAAYAKPIHTYVSDFGYVAATPTNQRVVLPNKYGAYLASKVAQNLMVGSAGTFALVDRKAIVDGFDGVPDRGKSIVLGERSAWIDPETWPALGRKVGVKLVFMGQMEAIGADLNVTVWLADLERGTKLAIVEHKIALDRFRAREFETGNLPPQPPASAPGAGARP